MISILPQVGKYFECFGKQWKKVIGNTHIAIGGGIVKVVQRRAGKKVWAGRIHLDSTPHGLFLKGRRFVKPHVGQWEVGDSIEQYPRGVLVRGVSGTAFRFSGKEWKRVFGKGAYNNTHFNVNVLRGGEKYTYHGKVKTYHVEQGPKRGYYGRIYGGGSVLAKKNLWREGDIVEKRNITEAKLELNRTKNAALVAYAVKRITKKKVMAFTHQLTKDCVKIVAKRVRIIATKAAEKAIGRGKNITKTIRRKFRSFARNVTENATPKSATKITKKKIKSFATNVTQSVTPKNATSETFREKIAAFAKNLTESSSKKATKIIRKILQSHAKNLIKKASTSKNATEGIETFMWLFAKNLTPRK